MRPVDQASAGILLSRGQRGTLVQQVRSVILARIAAGAFTAKGRLPPSRQLAAELGTSRATVVAAYDQLVGEGYVEARERSGLFVNTELRSRLDRGRVNSRGITAVDDADLPSRVDWASQLVRQFPLPTTGVSDWDDYPYPFVTGQVDLALFPTRGWMAHLRRALDRPQLSASLADRGGDDPQLIEALCRVVLPARGLTVRPDQVAVTLGSQHGLTLLCALLLRRGDVVAMEDPGYPEARHLFGAFGARVRPLAVDVHGLRVWPDALAGARLVHVTPSHQHPTNVTMTAGRRQGLLNAADDHDVLVIEDDYDSELRYHGMPIPALTASDRTDRCVYLGSFSKLLAPGLRLGFLVGDPELVSAVRAAHRMTTRQVPGHLQRTLATFLLAGDYHRTLRRVRRELRSRWELATAAAAAHLDLASTDFPPGGSSLWLRSADADWTHLPEVAARKGVALAAQDEFYARTDNPIRHLRLGFAAIATPKIEPGIRALAAAAAELR